jgi:hypothetical protein
MVKEQFAIAVAGEQKDALRELVDVHARAARRWQATRGSDRSTQAERARRAAELADAVTEGRILPSLSDAIDWGLRRTLAERNLTGPLHAVPAGIPGRWMGVGTRVRNGTVTLSVRLARPFTPDGGSPVPLGEYVTRAAWSLSADAIARLEAWQAHFTNASTAPTPADRAYRQELARQVVTTGDLIRAALDLALEVRPAPNLNLG